MGKMGKKVKSKVRGISNIPTNGVRSIQWSEVSEEQEEIWKPIPKSHEVVIKRDEVGKSYKRLFCRCLDSSVTKLILEDPYLKTKHQITNLKEFLSLCTELCPNLEKIQIVTNLYDIDEFATLKEFYKKQHLSWKKDKTFHDRHIWLVKSEAMLKIRLGRGLDIYQHEEYDRFEQTSNQDEMKCMETTITVTEYTLEKSKIPTGVKAQAA